MHVVNPCLKVDFGLYLNGSLVLTKYLTTIPVQSLKGHRMLVIAHLGGRTADCLYLRPCYRRTAISSGPYKGFPKQVVDEAYQEFPASRDVARKEESLNLFLTCLGIAS